MPLTNLMKKDTKFDWSDTTNEVFSKLKQIFVTAPLLIQFDNTRETVLETNCQGLGQESQEDGSQYVQKALC